MASWVQDEEGGKRIERYGKSPRVEGSKMIISVSASSNENWTGTPARRRETFHFPAQR